MKSRILFIALSICAFFLIIIYISKPNQQAQEISYSSLEPLSLIIATDLHYLAPELTDHGSFFEQFIEDGDGKSMKYSNELVDAFVNQVVEQKPDALILSGDLTFNGELLSHQALAKKLHRIRENDIPIFVIPGNHDLENPMALTFDGEKYHSTQNITT